jgi:hypothetical protein
VVVGRLTTTRVVMGAGGGDVERCGVTGCETLTLCLGFWTRTDRCAAARPRCPPVRAARLADDLWDGRDRLVGVEGGAVSGVDAMSATALVTLGGISPWLEPPLERTMAPTAANTEAVASEALSARTGLRRRGRPGGADDAAGTPNATRFSAAFGSPRSSARRKAASAAPTRPCSASSTPRLPAAAACPSRSARW